MLLRKMSLCILLLCLLFISGIIVVPQDIPPLYDLPNATSVPFFTDSSLVRLARNRLLITNRLQDTVSLVDAATGTIEAEIPVGDDPRSITITDDASLAAVLNYGSGTVSLIDLETGQVTGTFAAGDLPFAIVTNNDNTAFISRHGTHDIIELELRTGTILQRIPTPEFPSGMALWGDFLYVTHFWSGDFSLIYLPTGELVRTISTGLQSGLSAVVELNPREGRAYLPQTIRNTNSNTPYDARQTGVLHTVDLTTMRVLPQERVLLPVAAQPVNLPFAAALNNTRDLLYIAAAGSNTLVVLDLDTRTAAGIVETGAYPRGMRFSQNNQLIYVHNALDSSISEIGTPFFDVQDIFATTTQPPDVTLSIGAQLFHSASDSRMSLNNAMSCATCHYEGHSDGLVWTGMNTPALYNLSQSAPYGRQGGWSSLDGIDGHLRTLQAGEGLELNSLELNALKEYVARFLPPVHPALPDERLMQRGQEIFEQNNCAACHQGTSGTDGQLYDVGTGGSFVTPSLTGLWQSAPYLHDGSAATLREVLTTGQGMHRLAISVPESDIEALIHYLLHRG